jgi:IMP dehydrogenase/GMP reductase
MKDIKFDFEDIAIVPAVLSYIDSRSEIDLSYFPLFVAPMDTVIDKNNVALFRSHGYHICMPRKEGVPEYLDNEVFHSFGLDEIINMLDTDAMLPQKVLIDVANGHMLKLYNAAKRIKEEHPDVVLMVGNIANPETYRAYAEIGVDFIRVGIGGGSRCTTSANAGIHYAMGSLIRECYEIACEFDNPSKIVADGGFKKFDDIIKALALGADYVMVGGVLSKAVESCGQKFVEGYDNAVLSKMPIEQDKVQAYMDNGYDVYTDYRGMSTKEVQMKWGRRELKTAEGISKANKVEYTLAGWTENMIDYLKSNMSYCGKYDLESYKGEVEYIFISENARRRFSK